MDLALVQTYGIQFANVSTIALCIICKVPQIVALWKSQSARGMSSTSVMVELLGYMIMLFYNIEMKYPIMAYMEYCFLVSQDIVLLLVLFYFLNELDVLKAGFLGLFLALFVGFLYGYPFQGILLYLVMFVTPISASSKIIALTAILRSKDSGSVSVTTWLIAAYTCVSRLFTTYLQSKDAKLMFNYTVALTLNVLVISAAVYYRKPRVEQQQPIINSNDGKNDAANKTVTKSPSAKKSKKEL